MVGKTSRDRPFMMQKPQGFDFGAPPHGGIAGAWGSTRQGVGHHASRCREKRSLDLGAASLRCGVWCLSADGRPPRGRFPHGPRARGESGQNGGADCLLMADLHETKCRCDRHSVRVPRSLPAVSSDVAVPRAGAAPRERVPREEQCPGLGTLGWAARPVLCLPRAQRWLRRPSAQAFLTSWDLLARCCQSGACRDLTATSGEAGLLLQPWRPVSSGCACRFLETGIGVGRGPASPAH